MMRNRISIIVLAAVIGCGVLAEAAFAAGRNYVDRRRTINAGVLVVQKQGGIDNWTALEPAASYIFYIMNQRVDIKPSGWSFANPLAGGKDNFKNFKNYWQVPLRQTTIENLAKFDVLYLSVNDEVRLQMNERDKLRRFVDGGGCLWIDNGFSGVTPMRLSQLPVYGFFLPGVDFSSSAIAGNPSVLASLHPLMTYPYWLAPKDINSLDLLDSSGNHFYVNPGFEKGKLLSTSSDLPNPTTLSTIVDIGDGKPTIACTEYGSGRLVVTSGFIGAKIQFPIESGNPASISPNSNFLRANPANLKFAYNVVAWASSATTLRVNYRHDGYSLENIGAPLIDKWKLPKTSAQNVELSAAVWKNVIFYSAGSTLYALDAVPEEDLDMDGNTDDGLDDPADSEYDIIWQADMGAEISSPTVAGMVDPRGGTLAPQDFVFVTCKDTQLVYIFQALPNAGGMLSGIPVNRNDLWAFPTGKEPSTTPSVLAPPVVQAGWIYAAGAEGILYAHSPVYATAGGQGIAAPGHSWWVPVTAGSNPGEIKSALILGFSRNRATGAVIQSVSFASKPGIAPSSGVQVNEQIQSVPVFVSSDKLTPLNPADLTSGGTGPFTLRLSFPQFFVSQYPEPQVWALDTEGKSVSVTPESYANQGQMVVKGNLTPNVRVYASYGIDYSRLNGSGMTSYSGDFYRIEPQPYGGSTAIDLQSETIGTPALGPNDAFYFGVRWPGATGGTGNTALYCAGYEGVASGSRLKWSYFLHGGGDVAKPSYNSMNEQSGWASIQALDPTHHWGIFSYVKTGSDYATNPMNASELLRANVANLQIVGTPAVTNEKVFVTATTSDSSVSGGTVSRSYLLCFKNDQTFTIRANRPFKNSSTKDNLTVTIWQPDLMFSATSRSTTDVSMMARQIGGDMVDYDTGAITITDFSRVRLRTSPVAGLVLDAGLMSPSLPVWIFLDGTPIPMEQIDFTSWDNLLWVYPLEHSNEDVANPQVIPCPSGISSSPVVIGDYVYMTCNDGHLFAVDASGEPMDKDYHILVKPLPAPGDPSYNDVLAARTSRVPMCDQIYSAANTKASCGNIKSSASGSGGALVVPTDNGLHLFNNPLTLVTDNHRVMEIGGDNKILWACDSVYEPKVVPAAQTVTPGQNIVAADLQSLSKPVVAQKFGGSDYLVVDSGNDRVLRMDRGGQIMWSLKEFADPKGILRSGEPKTLKAPADARAWSELENIGDTDNPEWRYVVHCLVVDTGNFRIVDIVDRYVADANGQVQGPELGDDGQPVGHQLQWVSHTSYRDKRFTFNSIQLVRGTDGGRVMGQVWASVSNYGLGTATNSGATSSVGSLGGAILALDYRKAVSDTFDNRWEYHDGEVKAQMTTLTSGGTKVRLSGPRFFTVLNPTKPDLLICDSSAVYCTTGSDGSIAWQLSGADYAQLNRSIDNLGSRAVKVPFSPYRVQLLSPYTGVLNLDDKLLIVNNYAGRTNDPEILKFTGEVFQVDVRKSRINWYAPNMVYTAPAQAGDPGDIVQQLTNAPNFDQPTCAQRLQ